MTSKKILSCILAASLLSGMIPAGMTASADDLALSRLSPKNLLTAQADPALRRPLYEFNATSDLDESDKWQYQIPDTPGKSIKKVEVLIEMEEIAPDSLAQVLNKNTDTNQEIQTSFLNVPGIKKYTAEGLVEESDFADVQLVGKGKLLAYRVTFKDDSTAEDGYWDYPEYTAPTAKNPAANGEAQELITAGETNGGTLVYSLDGENYSKEIPRASRRVPIRSTTRSRAMTISTAQRRRLCMPPSMRPHSSPSRSSSWLIRT